MAVSVGIFIAAVIAAGAVASAEDTMGSDSSEAYQALKDAVSRWIRRESDIKSLEGDPSSEYSQANIAKLIDELSRVGRSELLELARDLVIALRSELPKNQVGVDIERLAATNVRSNGIRLTGVGYSFTIDPTKTTRICHVFKPKTPKIETQDLAFTAFHPKELNYHWTTLLVYTYLREHFCRVQRDAEALLDSSSDYGQRDAGAELDVAPGAEITVVPRMPGCQFNPSEDRFSLEEEIHRREFRIRADPNAPGFDPGAAVNGTVSFYVGPLLIAEVKIWTVLSGATSAPPAIRPRTLRLMNAGLLQVADSHNVKASMRQTHRSAPAVAHETASSNAYSAIFVSYARKDADVVKRVGTAYRALGMNFLRDVEFLHSGQKWSLELLKKIDQADIFQLFWSKAAKRSRNVEQEWLHALAQQRDNFIRPVYWEKPMPKPPSELSDIHFHYYSADRGF